MSVISFQKRLLEEIVVAFEPITFETLDDSDTKELFESIGYNVDLLSGTSISSLTTKINTIGGLINTLNGSLNTINLTNILDVINAFSSIVSIPNTIGSIHTAFPSSANSIVDPDTNQPIANDIPKHFINYIVVSYLFNRSPLLAKIFYLLGIIYADKSKVVRNTSGVIVRERRNFLLIDFGKLGSLLSNPKSYLGDEFFDYPGGITDREKANQSARKIFGRLSVLLGELDVDVFLGNGDLRPSITQQEQDILEGMISLQKVFEVSNSIDLGFGVNLGLIPHTVQNKQGVFLAPFGTLQILKIIGDWALTLKASAQSSGMEITGEGISFHDTTQNRYNFKLSADSISSPENPAIHIGSDKGTRFEIDRMGFEAFLDLQPPDKLYGMMMKLHQMKFVLKGGDGDGFMSKILGIRNRCQV